MYATAAARQDGLLLLCGGRSEKGHPLNDAYGLARHRDGRWEWAAAPNNMPVGRYQHAAVFVGARLHVSGGSLGGGKMVDKKDSILILDSTAGMWASPAVREGSDDLSRRCRRASASAPPACMHASSWLRFRRARKCDGAFSTRAFRSLGVTELLHIKFSHGTLG